MQSLLMSWNKTEITNGGTKYGRLRSNNNENLDKVADIKSCKKLVSTAGQMK